MIKIQHLLCQRLVCSTKPCHNKRPDRDNLIVRVTFYDKIGNEIIGSNNIMVELKLIIVLLTIKYIPKELYFSQHCMKNALIDMFIHTAENIINLY